VLTALPSGEQGYPSDPTQPVFVKKK